MFNIYLSAETIENINETVSVTFYGLGRNVGRGGEGGEVRIRVERA